MGLKEEAAKVLNAAYQVALYAPASVCNHQEFIDYVIDNTHLLDGSLYMFQPLLSLTHLQRPPELLHFQSQHPCRQHQKTVKLL